ncbi:hypothetical protein Y032_0082g1589 [Ancylostoma ceylanicum]|uniref:7TM GPCR serpentine receptor class x (Srx) domain-containing protein n=1 Tax=Ancylostoma ceylanicum TaxID=53326 RepID=A0A016TSS2_9BILA|nr:hypothetical protein Y032_0082g1589 [Ancylostoma ceylanicum]
MRENVENIIAAVCCAILGIVGLFINGSCVLLTINIKSLNTSFGFLTLYHSLSNGVLISSYVLWVAPCILFDLSTLFGLNRSIGQITIIAQAASYFSMFLLSTNRMLLFALIYCLDISTLIKLRLVSLSSFAG